MAGPDDSAASSSHHQDNPPDTSSDLRLQPAGEEEDGLLNEKKKSNPLTMNPISAQSLIMEGGPYSTDTAATALKPGEHLRVDLRRGGGGAGDTTKQRSVHTLQSCVPNTSLVSSSRSTTSLNSEPLTSQPVCQVDEASEDVFDVSSHHHPCLFSIENVDDDDDVEEEDLGNDAFEDSDREYDEDEEGDEDLDNVRFSRSVDEDSECGMVPGHSHDNRKDVARSTPWTIPTSLPVPTSPGSSPLVTVCRHSHGSQVVVRCQIQSPGNGSMSKTSSCPTAFSPLWAQLLPSAERRGSGSTVHAEDLEQRFGTNTDSLQLSSATQPQDDPSHVSFKGRSRSYSDSDVQRLLIKDVSKELRRMGDEFYHYRKRRTTRMSEPIIEENMSTFGM